MKLNSVEWARAQELLLKLAQVVGPFASREPTTPQAMAFTLSRHFFVPPSGELPRFHHAARLLTSLAEAKKEVDEWIGKLPETESETEKKDSPLAKPGIDAKTANRREGDSSKTDPKNGTLNGDGKGKGSALSTQATRGPSSGAETKTGQPSSNFDPKSRSTPSQMPQTIRPQVASQAQQVIDQVRQAILTLSTSAYLIDPKAGPLRDALKRLKPFIDQLIEAVSQDGMHSAGDGLPPLFRFKIPPSEREALLKKLIPFPQTKKNSGRSFADSSVVQETKNPLIQPGKTRSDESFLSQKDSLDSMDKETRESTFNSYSKTTPGNVLNSLPAQGDSAAQPESPVFDRTTIPGAPFTPQNQPDSLSRKKKKRKSFWLRDEDDEEENPKRNS